jgi:hypothetical protein
MSLYNHQLTFRPLLGGIEIYVPRVDEVGTLGFVARDQEANEDWWLVSCYHVVQTNTPILQALRLLIPL